MHLSDHSLRQIDDDYIRSLGADVLRDLSLRLLADLKEARERLNQGPTNSSRPPSSRAPWERGEVPESTHELETPQDEAQSAEAPLTETQPAKTRPAEIQSAAAKPTRKAGKQPGAPGVGRTQVLEAQELIAHYPGVCAGCGRPLTAGTDAVAYTGFQAVDLRWGEPGLRLWVMDHRYYEVLCDCGHRTRAVASRGEVDPLLAGVELSEWRLVGPGLAWLPVALALRFRLSRARMKAIPARVAGGGAEHRHDPPDDPRSGGCRGAGRRRAGRGGARKRPAAR